MSSINPRAAKKAKLSSPIIDINNNEEVCFGKNTTVLSIKNNDEIKDISDCKNLSVLTLENTSIEKIYSCPNLYHLTVNKNDGLEIINLPSVKVAQLKDICDIDVIKLESASKVILDNMPMLTTLLLPNALDVSISNMDLFNMTFRKSIPRAISLNLHNVSGMKSFNEIKCNNLMKLVIDNCSFTSISNLDGYDEIIIENCSSLRHIENISNVDKLTINNCPELFSLDTVKDVLHLHVSRCETLRRIRNIEGVNLFIEYCFNLLTLDSLYVEKIKISRCPFLVSICLHPDLLHLIVDHCSFLESLKFNYENPFCYSNLRIDIIGDNMIQEVQDWYASKLVIKENQTLERIIKVHNLIDLTIIDCVELNTISEIYITNNLTIQCCPSLEDVLNVHGFGELSLIDCEALTNFHISGVYLKELSINGCPGLNTNFHGDNLKNLTLINTGFVIVHSLSNYSTIDIKNARLLPNLSSTNNQIDTLECNEDIVNNEAMLLKSHMNKLFQSAKCILGRYQSYNIRCNYLQFIQMKKNDRICDCVICQETISPETSKITKCGHIFHSRCLSEWFSIRRTCPLCNYES